MPKKITANQIIGEIGENQVRGRFLALGYQFDGRSRLGTAANLAAKLTSLNADQPTWITKRVYDCLANGQKFGSKGENVWRRWKWNQHNDDEVYSSNYWRAFI